MSLLYRLFCGLLGLLVRGGGARELEIIVLRHQLAILKRGGKRPQYTTVDRALLAAASRLLPPERWSCFALSPRTLRRWHRALLQGNRQPRHRPGRPPLAAATRSLIQRLARENPRWGYMRIQGELLKLGISVSATTVATVLRVSDLGPAPGRISPSWSEFLRAQAQSMLGVGLPSQPGCGLEGNISAVTAPSPEAAACGAPAGKLASTVTEERWFSSPVRAPPRLAAVVAAVPSPGDPPAAPTRPSQQWQPRDGPRTRRRFSHPANPSAGVSKPSAARCPACELPPRVRVPLLRDSLPEPPQHNRATTLRVRT